MATTRSAAAGKAGAAADKTAAKTAAAKTAAKAAPAKKPTASKPTAAPKPAAPARKTAPAGGAAATGHGGSGKGKGKGTGTGNGNGDGNGGDPPWCGKPLSKRPKNNGFEVYVEVDGQCYTLEQILAEGGDELMFALSQGQATDLRGLKVDDLNARLAGVLETMDACPICQSHSPASKPPPAPDKQKDKPIDPPPREKKK